MKNFRILYRNIRDGIKNVFRNFSLSVASISCITVTLLLVSFSIVGSLNVENFTKEIRDDFTIVTYIANEADENKLIEIKNDLKKIKNIDTITLDSKEQIAERMKKESEIFKNIISSWDASENPLYNTYLVKVKKSEKISNTAKKIEKIDGVVMVKYGQGMIESLMTIFDLIKKILVVIVLSLVVVTAFLIINTIKITIFSRQEEIEIKRLVGASNFCIKQPFVIEGLILGIFGSIIPIMATIYGYSFLFDKTGGVLFSKFIKLIEPFPFVLIISGVLIILGIIVGMIGSSGAVKKYLKI